ncbi:hypothetical protein KUH03_31080 [Sphingobacterium sp. E70]|uniref:hypothetical protein n=1 Tax=Sphingobacterium sp. E70 TaxID=2853439 RepID=UPI00211CEEB8|nr:hypothetical protein [Sphingobacterium sp. E70]ULT23580.1 hypothetical protein KUH03_31080 [Sphingobacterium sp. E70]
MEQYGKQDFEELLQITALQIQLYKNVYLHYTGFNECDSAMEEDKAKFIHKYSRYVVLKERFISCFL